jgi:hypothetical protein
MKGHYTLLCAIVALALNGTIIARQSAARGAITKVVAIAWHSAEIFAGGYVLKNDFYWTCRDRGSWSRRIAYGVGGASALFHGLSGLDNDLQLRKRISKALLQKSVNVITS